MVHQRSKVRFNCWRPTDLNPGFYHISITESSDSGVSQNPLYANQNDRIITDLEVRSSLEYEPIASQSATTFIQTGNTELGDAPNTFVSSSLYGNPRQKL